MRNQDSIELLKETDKGVQMAIYSFDQVLEKVSDPALKKILTESRNDHKRLKGETGTIISCKIPMPFVSPPAAWMMAKSSPRPPVFAINCCCAALRKTASIQKTAQAPQQRICPFPPPSSAKRACRPMWPLHRTISTKCAPPFSQGITGFTRSH